MRVEERVEAGLINRTRITSQVIGALLDRDNDNHRFQQGLNPRSGTLNTPQPTLTRRLVMFGLALLKVGAHRLVAEIEIDWAEKFLAG